jgi:eukaryotic-like serine/threonine-protein kinase
LADPPPSGVDVCDVVTIMAQAFRRIGKYELLDEIGRGGFATVYKARDTKLNRVIALKVLHPYRSAEADFVERFRREAEVAANLDHPNIVTVYEADEADGQLYLAMKYVRGRTPREMLQATGVLPLDQALPLLTQIASALDYAHAQGVVHRDIKPSNIIADETNAGPRVTVLDFGLVKALEGSTQLTREGTLLGSPEYMAPEQADPNRGTEIGPATDRYALGIVAYQMLTGRVPFPGETPATLNAHLNLTPPDPRLLRRGLDSAVAAALLKMLAKDPRNRFATSQAFVEALRSVPVAAPVAIPVAGETRTCPQCGKAVNVRAKFCNFCGQVLIQEPPVAPTPVTSSTPPSLPRYEPPARATSRKSLRWLWTAVGLLSAIGLGLIGVSLISSQSAEREKIAAQNEAIHATQTVIAKTLSPRPTPAPPPVRENDATRTAIAHEVAAEAATSTAVATLTAAVATQTAIARMTADTPMLTGTQIISTTSPLSETQIISTTSPLSVLTVGSTQTRPTDGMTMVYVPAGTFKMGSDTGESGEKPVHDVTLDAFWIDRTEVTNAQYAKCVSAHQCDAPSSTKSATRDSYYGNSQYDNYPVIYVSWNDADKYCKWAGGQLPSEAQWEYAARGPQSFTYPWGDAPPDKERLNYNQTVGDTTEVGSYPQGKSWVGALDLAGNVWEWVEDWYQSQYPAGPQTNPTGPTSGDVRVLRGGSWNTDASYVRTAYRIGSAPGSRDVIIGFRCVVSPGE